MRLDFNVLWVDDQQNNVEEDAEKLARLIRREGFRLRTWVANSVEEAARYISENVYRDSVDLILMDYHLDGGPNGDQGLVEVRSKLPYREMVFYSAAANKLKEVVAAAGVEGVYCSSRNDLPDTANEVFQTLIKKVIDIDHSRGIVMGATSDIDHVINDCLTALFDSGGDGIQEATLNAITDRMAEIRSRFDEAAAKVEAAKHVSELFDHHMVYTSGDRANLLRKALKASGMPAEKTEAVKKYVVDVGPRRNVLAHVRVQVDGLTRKLIDLKGNEVTSEEMRTLRVELLDLQEALETLLGDIKAAKN
jgi:CheY-like chemotaxis protein